MGSLCRYGLNWLGNSSNHHADGNIVVIIWIFSFMSIFLKDGLKGIITNDLSERLEGDRVNNITVEGGRNFHSNSFNLIDWNSELLGSELVFFGSNKSLLFWWLSMDLGSSHLVLLMVLMMMLIGLLVMMVLVVMLSRFQIHEIIVDRCLLVIWHHVLDESNTNVLSKRILNLSV